VGQVALPCGCGLLEQHLCSLLCGIIHLREHNTQMLCSVVPLARGSGAPPLCTGTMLDCREAGKAR
jgi:hypothetical protein